MSRFSGVIKIGEKLFTRSRKGMKAASKIATKSAKSGGKFLGKSAKLGGKLIGTAGIAGVFNEILNGDPNSSNSQDKSNANNPQGSNPTHSDQNANHSDKKNNSSLRTDISVGKDKERHLRDDLNKAADKVNEINDKIKEYISENEKLDDSIKSTKLDLAGLREKSLSNLSDKQIEKLRQNRKSLINRKDKLRGEVTRLSDQVAKDDSNETLQNTLVRKTNELEKVSQELIQVESTLTTESLAGSSASKSKIEAKILKKNNELDELRTLKTYNDSQIQKLTLEKDIQKERINLIQQELGEQSTDVNTLEQRLYESEKDHKSLSQIVATVKEESNNAWSIFDKIMSAILLLPAALDVIKYAIDEGFSKSVDNLKETANDLLDSFDLIGISDEDLNKRLSTPEGARQTINDVQTAKKIVTGAGMASMAGQVVDGASRGVFTKQGRKALREDRKVLKDALKKSSETSSKEVAKETIKSESKEVAKKTTSTTKKFTSNRARKKAEKKATTLAAKKAARKAANNAIEKGLAKATEKEVGKAAGKALSKSVGKSAAKTLLKRVPILGTLMGIGFGISRAINGDWVGAGLEVASGAAGLLDLIAPGLGTAAGLAIDAGLAYRDISELRKAEQKAKDALAGFDEKDGKKVNDFLAKNKEFKKLAKEGNGEKANSILNSAGADVGSQVADAVKGMSNSKSFTAASKKLDTKEVSSGVASLYSNNLSLQVAPKEDRKGDYYYIKFIGLDSITKKIRSEIPNIKVVNHWTIDNAKRVITRLPFNGIIINNNGLLVNLAGGKFKEMIDEYFKSTSTILNGIDASLGALIDALKVEIDGGSQKNYPVTASRVNTALSILSDKQLISIKKKLIATLNIRMTGNLNDIVDPNVSINISNNREDTKEEVATDSYSRQEVTPEMYGSSNTVAIPVKGTEAERMQRAMDYLVTQKGLPPQVAAAVIGNLMAESRLNPGAFNPKGGGQGAYGIAQWRGSRQTELKTRSNWNTLEGQLDFVVDEMYRPINGGRGILNQRDVTAATSFFYYKFERPGAGDNTLSRRQGLAKTALKKYSEASSAGVLNKYQPGSLIIDHSKDYYNNATRNYFQNLVIDNTYSQSNHTTTPIPYAPQKNESYIPTIAWKINAESSKGNKTRKGQGAGIHKSKEKVTPKKNDKKYVAQAKSFSTDSSWDNNSIPTINPQENFSTVTAYTNPTPTVTAAKDKVSDDVKKDVAVVDNTELLKRMDKKLDMNIALSESGLKSTLASINLNAVSTPSTPSTSAPSNSGSDEVHNDNLYG